MKTLFNAVVAVGLFCPSALAQHAVAGEWMLTVHEQFGPSVMRLSLAVTGEQLTGTAGGRKIEGTVRGGTIEFKMSEGTARGSLEAAELKGETTLADRTLKWTAVRIPARPPLPRTHDFEPTEFHLYFSSKTKPPLRIHPGDTVRTWSVDAGGRDNQGNRRSGGGNPQTGPFYVEGALPGDTLVVRLNKVRTNRDWAGSGSTIMRNALEPGSLGSLKWDGDFNSRWKLDPVKSLAFLEKPTDALKRFSVPLQPMLGCVAVAPQ